MHRCGRCQAEFTALEDFVQHKLQKACQRAPQEALPATPAAALLGREVSTTPPAPHHRTQVCIHIPTPHLRAGGGGGGVAGHTYAAGSL